MSAARLAKTAIKIPKRIERGPTDILKALASTVKYFPQGPSPLLQDDPYLLPTKPMHHDTYALAKLSGKSTAKFLLNKHPEMFYRDDSEPKVRSFLPPEEYREDMLFTEEDLKWCIDNNDIVNGMIAYNTLEKNDIKISNETLLDFFELICYTNEEQVKDILDFQKKFFAREEGRMLVKQTWNTTGLASKIFNRIKEDLEPARVYSVMIAGLCKYNDHAAAKQVFEDFKDHHSGHGLYARAYEGLLNSVPRLNSSVELAHAALNEIIKHMEEHLVKPDLRVLNSVLHVYRSFFCDDSTSTIAVQILNDMRALEIEPSLYSYVSLIAIITRSRFRNSKNAQLVPAILDYIDSNDDLLEVRDERDLEALSFGMRLISTNLHNLTYANKLHKIYLKRPSLFQNRTMEARYLDDYFRLIITTQSMEDIMNFYNTYVPKFRPGFDTYDALIEALDLYQADAEIVKKIGRDIVDFRLADKIKNDAIFRKDPDYVDYVLRSNMSPQERRDERRAAARENRLN